MTNEELSHIRTRYAEVIGSDTQNIRGLADYIPSLLQEIERLRGLMECPYTDNGTHWCAGCASYTDGSAGEFL